MNGALLEIAAGLLRDRRPYAVATVVRRERPSSASPGNTALITADGTVHGWIGGSCTQPEVVRHALAALGSGRPRLLGFGAGGEERADLVPVPMSCGSEGRVEVHVNPVFPVPEMVVVGESPVAGAVARLAAAMGWSVFRAAGVGEEGGGRAAMEGGGRAASEGGGRAALASAGRVEDLAGAAAARAERPPGAELFAVVATMGRGDEEAAAQLAAARPDYLGVVASPKRMALVRRTLRGGGLSEEDAAGVRGPAGLDIGAESPEEVAVSIMAEIVAARAGRDRAGSGPGRGGRGCGGAVPCRDGRGCEGDSPGGDVPAPQAPREAVDPVCGMTVAADGSRPSSTYEGRTVHFCCHGCRARFEADPGAFAGGVR